MITKGRALPRHLYTHVWPHVHVSPPGARPSQTEIIYHYYAYKKKNTKPAGYPGGMRIGPRGAILEEILIRGQLNKTAPAKKHELEPAGACSCG